MLSPTDIDRVIEMAWEDRTPFEAIHRQFGLREAEVVVLMRQELTASAWRRWRARVTGRKTKHRHLRLGDTARFKSNRQRAISNNKVSKR
jgi:uncharacterized protein (TIGR03643 family)